MAVYADVDEVITLWRPTDETEKIEFLIEIASAKLRNKVPNLDARIASGEEPDLKLLAKAVVINAIIRALRNPAGIKQETTGPTSVTFDVAAASGLLEITDEDVESLSPPLTGEVPLFGTIFTRIPPGRF